MTEPRGVAVGRWIGRHTPRPLVRPLLALAKRYMPEQYQRAVKATGRELK